jgi:hypothetical protein
VLDISWEFLSLLLNIFHQFNDGFLALENIQSPRWF